MRIAVIGGGISGIAAARTLKRFGHEVIVYERGPKIGGVWAAAYPGVKLQNTAETYRLSDFPWPFPVELHPSGTDVLRYLEAAVVHFGLDVRCNHDVGAMRELPDGWELDVATPDGRITERFEYAIVASGHYTQERSQIALPGRETFTGELLSEYDIQSFDVFKDKRVAIVGFGKTAVDMTMFALPLAKSVTHVFRGARWLIPFYIGKKHLVEMVTPRSSTAMEPAWVHPGRIEAGLHKRFGFLVKVYGKIADRLVANAAGLKMRGSPEARARLKAVTPSLPLNTQMRGTMAPPGFYDAVADGRIAPVVGEIAGLNAAGLVLKDGREVPADLVLLAIGHKVPDFPFLPEPYRGLMRAEPDGTPLYRHVLNPRIPRLAFAGFNHGFLHVPAVELAMIWVGALLRGDVLLPSSDEMLASAGRVHEWKRAHTQFEPTRAYLISNHFHQYFDVLLGDLGVTPWRKGNRNAEINAPYGPADYATVFEEYEQARTSGPRRTLPLDT